MRGVEARVVDVGVDAGGDRFGAEFERGQFGALADLLGGDLVHRDAAGGDVWVNNDNDGLNDNSGENVFAIVGRVALPGPGRSNGRGRFGQGGNPTGN